ncbi:MAG: hypothetical protein GPJ54_06715 [Candidatus Heimdallarchaeota archaeon]|nr:hypothetical protein [Candidatus Heimdallarchaeota archaeon]
MEKFYSFALIILILASLSGIYYYSTIVENNEPQTGPIWRYSNQSNGISILLSYEQREPNEEAFNINSVDNEFESTYGCQINNSSMGHFNGDDSLYIGYSLSFDSPILDSRIIGSMLMNSKEVNQFNAGPNKYDFNTDWDIQRWTTTGILTKSNFSAGWILFQKIDEGRVTGPLSGEGHLYIQISILDTNLTLLFFAQICRGWIA